MPWASGSFIRTNGTNSGSTLWASDRDAGTKITAPLHDTHDQDMADGINACRNLDGSNSPSANLPMNSKKHTGLAVGTANGDSVTLGQVQNGGMSYVASDTGSANAYAIAPSPAITAYVAGQRFAFVAANASTGASTIDVSGLGTKAVEYQGAALGGAEIKAGSIIVVEYDGTAFQMVSPSNLLITTFNLVDDTSAQLGSFLDTNAKFISLSQGANIASVAGDTDIWANFDGNTVHITGTEAITDFGTPKQAGDTMTVIFDGAASVVDSATITVVGNANFQAAANDMGIVYALSTSTFLFVPLPNAGFPTGSIADNAIDETKLKDALIGDFSEVVVAAGDSILLGDVGDGGNSKRDTVQGILDLVTTGWEHVETVSASGSSTIELGEGNIDAGFDYIIRCIEVDNSVDLTVANSPRLQFGTGGTPTYQTSGYTSVRSTFIATSVTVSTDDTTAGVMIIAAANIGGTGAGETWDAEIVISNPAANTEHNVLSFAGGDAADNTRLIAFCGGKRTTAEVITGFRILNGTGEYTTGAFILGRRPIA